MPGEAEVHARAAGDWPMVGRLAAERWVARTLDGSDTNDGLLAGVPAIFGSEVFRSPVLQQIGREAGVTYVDELRDDDLPGRPG